MSRSDSRSGFDADQSLPEEVGHNQVRPRRAVHRLGEGTLPCRPVADRREAVTGICSAVLCQLLERLRVWQGGSCGFSCPRKEAKPRDAIGSGAPGRRPELNISLEKVCFVIAKGRELDVKVAPEELDEASDEDRMQRILEDYADDPPSRNCGVFCSIRTMTS
jgi:hypothetical protein